jgi:hypothetical protein
MYTTVSAEAPQHSSDVLLVPLNQSPIRIGITLKALANILNAHCNMHRGILSVF